MSKSSDRLYTPPRHAPVVDDGIDHGYRVPLKESELAAATMEVFGHLGIQLTHVNDHQEFAGVIKEIETLDPTFPLEWMPDLEQAARDRRVENWRTVMKKMRVAAVQQVRPGSGFADKSTPRPVTSAENEAILDRYFERLPGKARLYADHHVEQFNDGVHGPFGPCPAEPHETECPWVKIANEVEQEATT